MRRRLTQLPSPLALGFVAALLGAPSAVAAPPEESGAAAPSDDPSAILDAALEAWRQGEWTQVRTLLEPLVRDGGSLGDLGQDEVALRHLADATLLDDDLDAETRDRLATGYVERLLDADPDWVPPPATHGAGLYRLADEVRIAREREQAETCEVDRTSCETKLIALTSEHGKLGVKYDALVLEYNAEKVTVIDYANRNRALALIPFGVGHFYGDRPVRGGIFLGTETALGVTALALTLQRTVGYNCVRTNGFAPESLDCSPPAGTSRQAVLTVRNMETAFGLMFIGAMVVDVVVAQATFKKREAVGYRRIPRAELEAEVERLEAEQSEESEGRARRRKRRSNRGAPDGNAKLRARPTFGASTGGAAVGVKLDF